MREEGNIKEKKKKAHTLRAYENTLYVAGSLAHYFMKFKHTHWNESLIYWGKDRTLQ